MGTTWRPFSQGFFFNGRWRIKWLFGNVSRSFATYGVHGSAIACLRIAWESQTVCTGLFCDVPGVTLGNVVFVEVPIMARQALQPSPNQKGAEELLLPKLSLVLRHRCPQWLTRQRMQNISSQMAGTTSFGRVVRCTYSCASTVATNFKCSCTICAEPQQWQFEWQLFVKKLWRGLT